MSTDNREDYLINILRLTDGEGSVKTTELANFMKVSPASVSEMLKILQSEGMVNYRKYRGVTLTDEGLKKAMDLRRKHHIIERFLTDVLDVDHMQAHEEACVMEHMMSDDSANKMCRMMGTKVSRDCESCTDPCHDSINMMSPCVPLSDMDQGQKGTISHLSNTDSSVVRRLISLGFVPGRAVELDGRVSDKGARIVKIGDTTIALDKNMASAVMVTVGA
jgi:DtxR family Mn-dependent transcriptional regulator